MKQGVAILGIFVADLAFRADRQPVMGETLMGSGFKMGPGGKGSNQAVAAARAGAQGELHLPARAGCLRRHRAGHLEGRGHHAARGARPIRAHGCRLYLRAATRPARTPSSWCRVPPAASALTMSRPQRACIEGAKVFVTQLEQPIDAARRGLEIARAAGVITVFNPAPAAPVPDDIYRALRLCDPQRDAKPTALTGLPVDTRRRSPQGRRCAAGQGRGHRPHHARRARRTAAQPRGLGDDRRGQGRQGAGDDGRGRQLSSAPSPQAWPTAWSPLDAARFGCAAAGISVTRPGTAPAMPTRAEIEALLGN